MWYVEGANAERDRRCGVKCETDAASTRVLQNRCGVEKRCKVSVQEYAGGMIVGCVRVWRFGLVVFVRPLVRKAQYFKCTFLHEKNVYVVFETVCLNVMYVKCGLKM